jgi:hypothetical protein
MLDAYKINSEIYFFSSSSSITVAGILSRTVPVYVLPFAVFARCD